MEPTILFSWLDIVKRFPKRRQHLSIRSIRNADLLFVHCARIFHPRVAERLLCNPVAFARLPPPYLHTPHNLQISPHYIPVRSADGGLHSKRVGKGTPISRLEAYPLLHPCPPEYESLHLVIIDRDMNSSNIFLSAAFLRARRQVPHMQGLRPRSMSRSRQI